MASGPQWILALALGALRRQFRLFIAEGYENRTNKKKSGSFEASGENRGNFKLNFNRLQIDNLGPGYMLYYSRGLTAFSGRTSLASDSRNLYRC